MRYLTILPLLLITALLWSQPIDNKRMKRDIEVAENILAALIEDASSHAFQAYQVEGTYLESYGLLFTIQSKFGVFGVGLTPAVIWDGNRATGRAESRDRRENEARGQAYSIKADSSVTLDQEKIKIVAETFLADYGYLLTQLPDNQKICIKYSKGKNGIFPGLGSLSFSSGDNEISTPGFTMVIPKKVVEDHRNGKIDRKALISRIEYSETEAVSSEADRELILLNSIFNRLYQRDLSDGFHMRGNGRMEKIAGLGVLFSYSFSTRGQIGGLFFNNDNNQYRYYYRGEESDKRRELRALEKLDQGDELEEPEDEPEEEPDFEEFLEDFKSNIIEYGSTVRHLKSDEVLSFELNFPSCRNCHDRPENVKITAKQALLEQYRKGELELEEAVEQLQVKY